MEKSLFMEYVKPGIGIAMEAKKVAEKKGRYEKVEVYKTKCCGYMLVIDGAIMLTELDEFAYHEMIVHPAMLTHPKPKKVLVIGGGDGGAIREIVKHNVERIDWVELEDVVVEVSKKFYKENAKAMRDKRVKLHIGDGFEFLKEHRGYDVIFVDSPDPVGEAKKLFSSSFYKLLYAALSKDGMAITQSESFYYHKPLIKRLAKCCKKLFPIYRYYWTAVPTYPSGVIGFSFCSKKHDPLKIDAKRRMKRIKGWQKLKYYSPEIHRAAFALPRFAAKLIE